MLHPSVTSKAIFAALLFAFVAGCDEEKASSGGAPSVSGSLGRIVGRAGAPAAPASAGPSITVEADVVCFRGDQRHSYVNTGPTVAVRYSGVVRRPGS